MGLKNLYDLFGFRLSLGLNVSGLLILSHLYTF
jgi:hypothetical protein